MIERRRRNAVPESRPVPGQGPRPPRARLLARLARFRASLARLRHPAVLIGLLAAGLPTIAHAGGGPDRTLLLIDPGSAESRYIGNLYAQERGIPDLHIVYMKPDAPSFEEMTEVQHVFLRDELAARGIADRIDTIVIASTDRFYTSIPVGTIPTGCQKVSRISLSSAYTFMEQSGRILAGEMHDQMRNEYYGGAFVRVSDEHPFSSETAWLGGRPSEAEGASRYRIAFQLGYTGERGNSATEIADMIRRSAAADFTNPEGTVFLMVSSDSLRTQDRQRHYARVVAMMDLLGGRAEIVDGVLPVGRGPATGILTGVTDPKADEADIDLVSGAFADHLTSFAGMFDSGSQGKMSQWIRAGASGSLGTVEEPCTGGKFPDADLHSRYRAGMSLGEALFRSVPWTAFQSLFYGDPLTRPYGEPPTIEVQVLDDVRPGVAYLEVFVSNASPAPAGRFEIWGETGRIHEGAWPEQPIGIEIDRGLLHDGYNELRIVAVDDTPLRHRGQQVFGLWNGSGRVSLGSRAGGREFDGDLELSASATGGPVTEVRLLEHGRIIAAVKAARGDVVIPVERVAQGTTTLRAEALYSDGRRVLGEPQSFEYVGPPDPSSAEDQPPIAFDYTLELVPGQSRLVSLPALDPEGANVDVVVLEGPDQAELRAGAGVFSIEADAAASGRDRIVFQAVDGAAQASGPATISIRYCPARVFAAGGPTERSTDPAVLRLCSGYPKIWLPALQPPAR